MIPVLMGRTVTVLVFVGGAITVLVLAGGTLRVPVFVGGAVWDVTWLRAVAITRGLWAGACVVLWAAICAGV
jgi:hypothetical protein